MSESVVLVIFLATAIERIVELITDTIDLVVGWMNKEVLKADLFKTAKRVVAYGLALGGGAIVAYGVDLDLIRPLLDLVPDDTATFSNSEAKFLTMVLLAGGAAPAHELIKLVTNKKEESEADKDAAEAKAKVAVGEAKARGFD